MPAAAPKFDPAVIYEFAARLYRQADMIAYTYAIISALIGGGVGYFAPGAGGSTVALILAVVFGAIGFSIGRGAGFKLRLQAQTALCQVKIEENTRRS